MSLKVKDKIHQNRLIGGTDMVRNTENPDTFFFKTRYH